MLSVWNREKNNSVHSNIKVLDHRGTHLGRNIWEPLLLRLAGLCIDTKLWKKAWIFGHTLRSPEVGEALLKYWLGS